jgi:hypothetical protein
LDRLEKLPKQTVNSDQDHAAASVGAFKVLCGVLETMNS